MDTTTNQQAEQTELGIIDNLAISNKLKDKLRLVHENLRGTKFGLPDIRPKEDTFNNRVALAWKLSNEFACIFNILYYSVKGMWRKALVLLGISIAIMLIVGLTTEDTRLMSLSSLAICAICRQCAYHNLYRKLVKKEEFWW